MKYKLAIITIPLLLLAIASQLQAETQTRRYLLSIGANNGGRDKVVLRYAVSDAQAFASVLTDMGGVEKSNVQTVANPTRAQLLASIDTFGKRIAAAAANPATANAANAANADIKNEVFVYYSGHADERGLRLAGETLSWAEFRNVISNITADVLVAVIDACGSGAITRNKGGVEGPAFMSDASMNMTGYAFLTSSNEKESSQESDRIRGSIFTHALLSGMRGAADFVGDGKVTVNEAYQYAFSETLRNTKNTRSGTQHPSRDMNLTGTGDIVLTDLRQTNAALSFAADMDGQLFIRDARGHLFAELRKERGRVVELGLPSGRYTVQMETPARQWLTGSAAVSAGGKTQFAMNNMKPMSARERTIAKGEAANDGGGFWDNKFLRKAIIDLTTYADIGGDVSLSLRAGVPWVYALAEYGYRPDLLRPSSAGFTQSPQQLGFGAGTRFGMTEPFAVNLEMSVSTIHGDIERDDRGKRYHKDDDFFYSYYKVRLGASYIPKPYFALTAGVSANWKPECKHVPNWNEGNRALGFYTKEDNRGHRFHVWPGLYAGITIGKVL